LPPLFFQPRPNHVPRLTRVKENRLTRNHSRPPQEKRRQPAALQSKKTTSLTRERDDALRIARGGSILRRIGRAAAGAVAAQAAH
jgi:hypothetical protein